MDIEKKSQLSNNGQDLFKQYQVSKQITDLNRAIAFWHEALRTTLSNSSDRPGRLNNLGVGLDERYKRTGDQADLETSISILQQAMQAAPLHSPVRLAFWPDLALGRYEHIRNTMDMASLEARISESEQSWSIQHFRFAALPVTYQLGQQYHETRVAAVLVSDYLAQAWAKQLSVRVIARLLKILNSIDNGETHSLPILLVGCVVARVMVSLIRANEKQEKQHPSRLLSIPPRVLEIAEGSKSRLLTQLVGRGSLRLPLGLSPEMAAREQHLLAELTTLDTQELATHDRQLPTQEERGNLQRLQQRQTILHELEELWTSIAHNSSESAEYVALRRGSSPTWQEFTHLTEELGPDTALLSLFLIEGWILLRSRSSWRRTFAALGSAS